MAVAATQVWQRIADRLRTGTRRQQHGMGKESGVRRHPYQRIPSGLRLRRVRRKSNFLLRTIKRLNRIEKSVDALRVHLEYSRPDMKVTRAPMDNPKRDVKAAILSDVMSLSSLKIREQLGLTRKWKTPQAHTTAVKREDATTRKAIKRGRALLEHFY